MLISRAFVTLLLVLAANSVCAQTPALVEQRIKDIHSGVFPAVIIKGQPAPTLADRMAALHVPGVSIAVIHDGKIEWARGFGVMRIGGDPVAANTLFQAGSISKPVAAMAVMRLVEKGMLDPDADVNQYLKSWKVPSNEFTAKTKVTLRQLLTHTAGMTVHGFPGYAAGAPVPSLVQVLNGEKPANTPAIFVDTPPGTVWRYSGGGYTIAQLLLVDVTGTPFPKLLHDTVLAPIGMTRSTYEQPLPGNRIGEAATPYRVNGDPVPGGPHTYPEMAAAGLWTTPSDLARYAIEVQQALAGKSSRVISAGTARMMLTPGKNGWGLGPTTGGSADKRYFMHGGSDEGFESNLVAYNSGDGAVIMTNGQNGGRLAEEILASVARVYGWPDFKPAERSLIKVDPQTFAGYVGAYRIGSDIVVTITSENGHLIAQPAGRPKSELLPTGDGEFLLKEENFLVTFDKGAAERATQFSFRQSGSLTTAKRLDDAESKRVMDAAGERAAWLEKKVREQTATPGSEALARSILSQIRNGQPDYEAMSPQVAGSVRQQLPWFQMMIKDLGQVRVVTFKGVGPGGGDIYEVKFDNGTLECRIGLPPGGKIDGLSIRSL
jgi:CubicO group peptidase (beta-lactamase class C family)